MRARLLTLRGRWAAVLMCGSLASCVGGDVGEDFVDDGLDRQAALTEIADSVILPALARFVESSAQLAASAAAWSDGVANGRADAQEAWRAAMADWQQLELMQVGPAGLLSDAVVGGESIRDEIYSWPFTKPCGVDQQIVARAYAAPDFAERELVYSYGLDALEYLLFVEGTENACPGPDTINTDGSWAALSDEQIAERRAAYAAVIAQTLQAQAEGLQQRWVTSGGNFRGVLLGELEGYDGDVDALDQVYDALFYVELVLKEQKLAAPAGVAGACAEDVCPDLVESPHALWSLEHIVANLQGVRAVYTGGGEGGFDALLRQAGEETMADDVLARLDAAREATSAIEQPLMEQLMEDPAPVRDLHARVAELTDAFKADFAAVLRLSVPGAGGGDTD